MAMPNTAASIRGRTEQAQPDVVHCPPMAHQNSGDHGYEMYPQQFVRLVGCHDASLDTSRKRQDEKLHSR